MVELAENVGGLDSEQVGGFKVTTVVHIDFGGLVGHGVRAVNALMGSGFEIDQLDKEKARLIKHVNGLEFLSQVEAAADGVTKGERFKVRIAPSSRDGERPPQPSPDHVWHDAVPGGKMRGHWRRPRKGGSGLKVLKMAPRPAGKNGLSIEDLKTAAARAKNAIGPCDICERNIPIKKLRKCETCGKMCCGGCKANLKPCSACIKDGVES